MLYPEPKGRPADASDLTRMSAEIGCWDHSHSYLSVDDFVSAYNRAIEKYELEKSPIKRAALFGIDWWPWEDEDEMRVVFAFDN